MSAAILNFDKENSIEMGATFTATIQITDTPDLKLYTGKSQVKISELATEVILEPVIEVLSHDTFKFTILHGSYTSNVTNGNYKYDVLFYNASDRFYAIRGSITLISTITKL